MKKNNPLVTVLTPCYNGEKYLGQYFNSILEQDYDNIQLILVNDGSIDNTIKVVEEYRSKLENKLSEFVLITQDNSGQAKACKTGLSYVHGKYLIWPDADDILSSNAISSKVCFLENHLEFGFCRANAQIVNAETGEKGNLLVRNNVNKTWLFEDFLFEKDIQGLAGLHMINFELYKKANPELKFYDGPGGQNWQFLLPISLHYECGFIEEIQYYYLVHSDSHSHSVNTYETLSKRFFEHEKIKRETIAILNLSENERNKYYKKIQSMYLHILFNLSWNFKDKSYKNNFKNIVDYDKPSFKEVFKYFICRLTVK